MKRNLFTLICLLFLWTGMYAQTRVTGVVRDENGEPIPGASVLIKGTTTGTITGLEGNFVLDNVTPETILEISFLGMNTEEVTVGNQTMIDMQLIPDLMQLDDVVVIGYGTVKRKDLTGAVASVSSEDITISPTTNTIEALQGRVAGLDIASSSGKAGASPSILLRGTKTLKEDENGSPIVVSPLYIIDGMPGSIGDLNPNDIVSIDVLKDASSTAIYGKSGANGVIIITTKQAEKGKMQVDFSHYTSINRNPSFPSPLQGDAWLDYLEEGYIGRYGTAPADRAELLSEWGLDYAAPYVDSSKWVNWMDETFQTGLQYNTHLSIRAGNEKVQSSFSLGHNRSEGIYLNDYEDRITLRENLIIQPSNYVKFGIVTGLIYKNRENRKSRINKAFGMVPLGDVYDDDGEINTYAIDDDVQVVSILADNIDKTYRNNRKSFNLKANPYVEVMPMKGLTIKSLVGTTLSTSRSGEYNSDHTYMKLVGSSAPVVTANRSTDLAYSYTWDNILSYTTSFLGGHNVAVTLVSEYYHSQDEYEYMSSENINYDEFLFYNIDGGENYILYSDYSMEKGLSQVGRLTYNYQGKYYLSGSVRRDGVSKLSTLKTWDTFTAISGAWRITEESYMQGTKKWLSNLKLRVGFGVAGSDNVDRYSSLTEVTSDGTDFINLGSGQTIIYVPTRVISNAQLSWEKTYSTNIGIDFGLFNGRVDGALEIYNQDSENLIYPIDAPYTGGGFSPKLSYQLNANIAGLNNKGVELTLNTRNIQTSDFQWNSTFTFSRNWNEFTSITLGSGKTQEQLISEGIFIGEPRLVIYDYKKTGIWQTSDSADAAVFGLEPGDVRVESHLNKESDGVWFETVEGSDGNDSIVYYSSEDPYTINANDDRQIVGQLEPKWIAGLNNTFSYKGFDLSVFVTARWGHIIDAELLGYFDHGSINIPDNYNYWTESNPTNDFPKPYSYRAPARGTSDPLGGNSLRYVDGSYIKIKNITLGYTLPQALVNKIKVNNFRVYGTIYNSLIYTKSKLLKGTDPETGASDSFPLYKQWVLGVNVSF